MRQLSTLFVAFAIMLALVAGAAAQTSGRIYVANEGSNSITVIDAATSKVLATIPTGPEPHKVGPGPIQVYATPDGRFVYVANQGTEQAQGETVSVVDTQRRQVVKTISVGKGAHGVVITPDGRFAWITNIYASTVSVIDIGKQAVVATIPVGKSPNGISFQR